MSQLGHSRRFRDVGCESALPPRTDIAVRPGHVRKVPKADIGETAAVPECLRALRVSPDRFRGLHESNAGRCGREQRSVVRSQPSLDEGNSLAELRDPRLASDRTWPCWREEMHCHTDGGRI
jgi:hypothetical protein